MKLLKKYQFIGLITILLASFILKAINLNYNSPFNDEAIYVVVGKLGVFNGDWQSLVPFEWMGGVPYLYPTLTSIAYQLGGISFSRILNILFFIMTLPIIYKITSLLYPGEIKNKNKAALMATALVAGSANGYYVARLATYDMPSFFLLLLGIYFLIAAEKSKKYPAGKYFISAVLFILSFLFKYVTGIFIPLFIAYSYWRIKNSTKYRKSIWLSYYLIPIVVLLGTFGLFKLSSLNSFFQVQVKPDTGSNYSDIFNVSFKEINFLAIFWLLGAVGYSLKKKWKQLIIITGISLTIIAVHLVAAREHTLDKHLFTTIAGFCIIAGVGISLLLESVLNKSIKAVYTSITLVYLVLFWITSFWLAKNYNNIWVNTYPALTFVLNNTQKGDVVLTETGADTQLAMINTTHPTSVFTFDWVEYGNYEEDEAIEKGLRDGYFEVLVLLNENVSKLDSTKQRHDLVVSNLNNLYTQKYEDNYIDVYLRNY